MKHFTRLAVAMIALLGFGTGVLGQTTLAAGDLALIGMDTPGEDFSFVAFVNLDAGTEIYFTDEEADGDYSIGTGEGTVLYTAPSGGVLAGTVITYVGNIADFETTSDGVLVLGNSGDGIIAYQGATVGTVTTFLHAIGKNSSAIGTFPVGFSNFMTFGNDDAEYNGTRTGTAVALMTSVNTSGNWTTSGNGVIPFNTTAFTITSGSSNSITTGVVATSPFCVTASTGAAGTVAYTSSGTFSGTFTAELSDASGSFASPTAIGTGASPISITIPAGTVSGSGYKIRVVNDNPATTGSESTAFAVINNPYPVTSFTASPSSGQIALSWTNPVGCFEKVIVIGKQGSAVNSDYAAVNLNGLADGADFTAGNNNWSARSDANDMTDLTALGVDNEDYLLYNGTGTGVTITGLSNGTDYHFRVLVVKDAGTGSLWSSGADANGTPVVLPSLVEVIVPQYMQGMNGTNNDRTPVAFRATLENLLPNATYRYVNQVVVAADPATTGGAGNIIFVNSDNSFAYTSTTSFTTSGEYGEFTTNASGSYTGWFITVPTSNARFTPGNDVYFRIRTNDGAGGTATVNYLTTSSTIRVIHYSTTASANFGTGVYGDSYSTAKDFVALYDNTSGTGRPITSTLIESEGIASTTVNAPGFYDNNVDGNTGMWGTIIPNVNANGIKRAEYRKLSDGSLTYHVTDNDGIWNGVNTVNPTGGSTTALDIPANYVDDMAIATGTALTVPANGQLTVNGILTTNSGLNLSDGASLITNGTITGTATVNKTLNDGDFHLLFPPVNNTVAAAPTFNGYYLDKYMEANGAWTRLTDVDNITPDQGYSIKYASGSGNLSFTGNLFTGDQTFSNLSYTAGAGGYLYGWNLVGNPFPSAVDLDLGGFDFTGLNGFVYVWNGSNYLAGPTNPGGYGTLTDNIIPPFQGFFVRTENAVNSFTIPQAARIHSSQAFYKEAKVYENVIGLTVSGNNATDKMMLVVNPEATQGYDSRFDAFKLFGNADAPQLYTLVGDQKMSVSTVNAITNDTEFDVMLQVGANGEYTLTAEHLAGFMNGADVYLTDLRTQARQNLSQNPSYTFQANTTDDPYRFKISFASVGVADESVPGIGVFAVNERIVVRFDSKMDADVIVSNLAGQVVAKESMSGIGTKTLASVVPQGIYLVTVVAKNETITRKVFVK